MAGQPLSASVRKWLHEQAERCPTETVEMVETARLLREIAFGTLDPPKVEVNCRQLRSCLPSKVEGGTLLGQKDLSCGDRLWRSVCVEGSCRDLTRRRAMEMREL